MKMRGLNLLWAACATALLALGAFVYFTKPHTITIPSILLPRSPQNNVAEATTYKLQEAEKLMDKAKTARIPLHDRQKQLEDSQRFFEEQKFPEALSTAAIVVTALEDELAKEKDKPKIAITFDAGAGSAPAQELIGHLRTTRTKITFFSTGKWTEQNPGLFIQILAPEPDIPNELGNHTYSHPHFMRDDLSDEEIRDQILRTEAIFQRLGASSKPLFRYPYGEHDARTDALVTELGYRIIGWSFDSLGWQRQLGPEQIASRVEEKIKPDGIVLMHVGSPEDIAAFPLIVERLTSQYRFVFVSEL